MKKNTIYFVAIIEFFVLIFIIVVLMTPQWKDTVEGISTLTIWSGVLTIVFLVFSVMGLLHIDEKISAIDKAKVHIDDTLSDYKTTSTDFKLSVNKEKAALIEEAKKGINVIISESASRQNLFDSISRALVEPAPDRKVLMFTNILRSNPKTEGVNYSYIYCSRGMAYLQMQQIDKALIDLNEALRIDDKTDFPLVSLGFYYAQIKDYNKSVEYYKKAIEKDSTKASNYFDTAASYAAMGDYDSAEKYNDMGLTYEPEFSGAYYNKALNLINKDSRDYELIERYLDHAILVNPLFYRAKINKANLRREQKDDYGAIKLLSEVINPLENKDFINALEQRGIAYKMLRMFPQAKINFNQVFLLDPTNVQNLCNISSVCLSMLEINESWTYYLEGIYQAEIQKNHTCDSDFDIINDTVRKDTTFTDDKNFDKAEYLKARIGTAEMSKNFAE